MGRICSMNGEKRNAYTYIGGKAGMKETTRKTKT
jgi:hypothetical protein